MSVIRRFGAPLAVALTVGLTFGLVASACAGHPSRYSRKVAQQSLTRLEAPGLTIGEFRLTKVVDGDTIRVDGLDSSLRLLGIDTEETFKTEGDRRLFEAGWEAYKVAKRHGGLRPGKYATPLGEDGKHYAQHFFDGVDKVRLERDDPAEIRDRYNRYLAYVLVQKNGVWVNYNVQCVRDGMAPYFPKYGQSRRYHAEFVAAEAEAKAAHKGIWAPGVMAYPDYPEREEWWGARGEFVAKFRADAEGKDNYIDITHWDAPKRLEELVGKPVVVLGVVGDVILGEKGPSRVTLSRRTFEDFPLVFFDRDLLGSTGLAEWKGEFITVSGTPSIYENKHTHKKQVQIAVDNASQIVLSPVPKLTVPSLPASAPPPPATPASKP